MASEIREFQVTIPAGTAKAAPVTVPMSMPPRIVEQINIRIPPGPSGLMGFVIAASGGRVLPINEGAWIVGDDDYFPWPLENQIDSGSWEVIGYNTGQYDHSVYVTFLLRPVTEQNQATKQPIALSTLSS